MAMAGRGLDVRVAGGRRLDGPAGRGRVVRVRAMVAPGPGGPMVDSPALADRAAVARARARGT